MVFAPTRAITSMACGLQRSELRLGEVAFSGGSADDVLVH
jgi:hypothetical protein